MLGVLKDGWSSEGPHTFPKATSSIGRNVFNRRILVGVGPFVKTTIPLFGWSEVKGERVKFKPVSSNMKRTLWTWPVWQTYNGSEGLFPLKHHLYLANYMKLSFQSMRGGK